MTQDIAVTPEVTATDSTQSIYRSLTRFFSGTLLSRATGLFRDMAMAAAFGSHPAVAAFMTSFRLSHLLRRLFGDGALHTAFVPHFEDIRKDDPKRSAEFFRNLVAVLTLFLTVLILLSEGVMGAMLYWGNFSEGNREIIVLTGLMLPSLLFICLFGLHSSLLQCEKQYFIPGVAPVAFNIVWIIAVLSMGSMQAKDAMPYMGVVVVLSCLAQWALTVPFAYRSLSPYLRGRWWQNLKLRSPELTKMLPAFALGLMGLAAVQVNNAMDYLFARAADPSGPAYLWYSQRIQHAPIGLFGVALAGALLPPLSRAIKEGSLEKFAEFLHFALRRSMAFMIPSAAAIFCGALVAINLVYGRGDFDGTSVAESTRCLWAYNVGLIPQVLVMVLAAAFYAQKNYKTPALVASLSVLLNLALNASFVLLLGWGAVSVAISTSICAWVNALALGWLIGRGVATLELRATLLGLSKVAAVSLLACLSAVAVGHFYLNDPSVGLLMDPEGVAYVTRKTSLQARDFFVEAGVFLGVLVLTSLLWKVEDFRQLLTRCEQGTHKH